MLQESIADSTLVGATCLGIASLGSDVEINFDWVIVDEAGKATPPEILVPICLGRKIVLVGDHKQLPPVVDHAFLKLQDKERMNINKEDLELSLFEYLERSLNDDCKNILDEQYRMNPVIGDLISKLFYESKLVSKTSKEEKTIPLKLYESKPLVWLSTAARFDRKEERISRFSSLSSTTRIFLFAGVFPGSSSFTLSESFIILLYCSLQTEKPNITVHSVSGNSKTSPDMSAGDA